MGEAYIADEELATAIFLALKLRKPLLLEGKPGVGKTEAAKAIAAITDRRMLRLQCYEGIDASQALYEWNYPRQLLALRQAKHAQVDLYSREFLIERPLLKALERCRPHAAADRRDRPVRSRVRGISVWNFLSEFQISIPEIGTQRASEPPVVVLTSNRTRELHDALRRRCVYHSIAYPDPAREAEIIMFARRSWLARRRSAVAKAVWRSSPDVAREDARYRGSRRVGECRDAARSRRRSVAASVSPGPSARSSRTKMTIWRSGTSLKRSCRTPAGERVAG